MDILSHFPPPYSPRPAQVKLLQEIQEAFQSGHRFVICEAPPGVGKSHVAATLQRWLGPTYVCTLTKQLQAQYLSLFEDVGARELKGRGAFDCERANADCSIGSIRFKHDPCGMEKTPPCPYRVARAIALASSFTLCNYASYLYNITAVTGGQRPLLVLDEGHEVEKVLMDFTSITIDAASIPVRVETPLPAPTDTEGCFEWLVDMLVAAEAIELEDLTPKAEKELEALTKKATYVLQLRDKEQWISEPLDRRTGFVLKPLTVRSFGERVFRYGARVLIMSATILDPEALASSLGIEDYAFVQAPCPFPVENRPVYVGTLNMTKQYRDSSWPAMVKQIEIIFEQHENEKGLLLTPSTEMLKYIIDKLPKAMSERIISAYGKTRMDGYNRHIDGASPSVLGASGLWEGADLFGDRSRFQIIPAVPRPFWGGQIAARAKKDPRWYRHRTYCQLVQGVGRSVRSETDSATTYVLDGDLLNEAKRADTMLPEWFRDAMVTA